MGTKLVIFPTDVAQWHALINEAERHCSYQLAEELESYLVFLLMRFSQQSQLSTSVIGMDFLKSMNSSIGNNHETWRDIGDKSLLFCGLFPGIAARRRVSIEYFITLGKSAYFHLASVETKAAGDLFGSLSDDFVILKNILQATRNLDTRININWSDYIDSLSKRLQ